MSASRSTSGSQLIERALSSRNEAWPAAEQALFEAAEQGASFEAAATHPDPVARQMAGTAARTTADARTSIDRATAYLDAAAQRFARTPGGSPPIDGIVANLTATFGPQLTGALALRLTQQPDMPHWRAMSTLAYLDRHRDPAVVPSLVRFAAQTNVTPQQELAVRILGGIGGSAVAAAVQAERARRGFLPPALAGLGGGGSSGRA